MLFLNSFRSHYNLEEISTHRTYLMGIAMIVVIIFHACCWVANPFGPLNIGYVGVDVFLFLSGYGLCSSFEKNPISRFYLNRFKRIYPIYFVSVCLAYVIYHHQWSFTDFLNNILTIGYYTDNGVNRFDWYVESLFGLYLIFPLFYYYSKLKHLGLALLFIATAIFLYFCHIEWYYDCLVSRLPIFLYGIMMYKYKSYRHTATAIIIGLLLYLPCRIYSSQFLASSLLVIPIIVTALSAYRYTNTRSRQIIDFCGKYSLEIYCANTFIHKVFLVYEPSLFNRFFMYLLLQLLFSYVLINISKLIKTGLSKLS